MTTNGTAMYDRFARHHHVPPLVADAVALAERLEFTYTVHPATSRLLTALASGITDGVIGETGTGAGVAWMASTAPSDTRIVSIELDEARATTATELFDGQADVTVLDAVVVTTGIEAYRRPEGIAVVPAAVLGP